jgi:hypothetical protein
MRFAGPSALTLLALAGGALAQGAPPNPRVACRTSAISLCHPEVSARDMPGVRACLVRNFDKVTPDCQVAMKAQRDRETDPNGQAAPQGAADSTPAPQTPPPHR